MQSDTHLRIFIEAMVVAFIFATILIVLP